MNFNIHVLALFNMFGSYLHDMTNVPIVHKHHEKSQLSQMALLN